MNACPKCKSEVVSLWKKMTIGSFRKYVCPECGAKISLAFSPHIIFLLLGQIVMLFGGLMALELIKGVEFSGRGGIWIIMVLFSFGMMITLPLIAYAYYKWVPLVSKDA